MHSFAMNLRIVAWPVQSGQVPFDGRVPVADGVAEGELRPAARARACSYRMEAAWAASRELLGLGAR
jgi:hypothetical protein